MSQVERKEVTFIQGTPYMFETVTWAPDKNDTRARFAVDAKVYVTGVGWDIVNPLTKMNAVLIAYRDKIKMKELLGYKHIGKSSDEITTMMKNMWGVDKV